MPGHRSIRVLDEYLGPKRVAEARAIAEQKLHAMTLRDIRKDMGFTQVQVAKAMGISQSALSQVESQSDMRLATLRRMVQAMGGDVDVVIRWGKGKRPVVVSTSQLKPKRTRARV